jgi:hypothetical protein
MEMTPEQRTLLEDKADVWRRASREGNMELRDYHRRCADALDALLNERDDLREALRQILDAPIIDHSYPDRSVYDIATAALAQQSNAKESAETMLNRFPKTMDRLSQSEQEDRS